MPTKKQLANLKPVQAGERRAAKPLSQHRSNRVVFKLTDEELAELNAKVRDSPAKNHSSFLRSMLGF